MMNLETDTSKTYLITGAAGFIGFYLAKNLLDGGCRVVGIDNVNDYYDVQLKRDRLEQLGRYEKFIFIEGDISDKADMLDVFEMHRPDVVFNLAAQAKFRGQSPGALKY